MDAFALQPLALLPRLTRSTGLTGKDEKVQPASHVDSRPLPTPTLDSRWFAVFAREHESALNATALRLCGNAADARDLVQETLLKGLENLARYRPGTDGRAWLCTILHHLFIDRCRARTRERRADVSAEELSERLAAPEPEAAPAWAAIGPDELRAALERIPEEFATVYRLHALEGRSYIEIAERLGIPKATVGTRLIRARRKLKELLMPGGSGKAEAP
ncbi:RNA polymerase sigma factor [Myxococcus stipitatus]|nr:RNA polymerase sigma factor [Myxococcus stipitatus]